MLYGTWLTKFTRVCDNQKTYTYESKFKPYTMNMKTIKVAEATNIQLDWLVATIEFPPGSYGGSAEHYSGNNNERWIRIPNKAERHYDRARYTTAWSQMGPIIEREGIEVVRGNDLIFPKGNEKGEYIEPLWLASRGGGRKFHGPTTLIAGARCYVASKLGETVEVPEELT